MGNIRPSSSHSPSQFPSSTETAMSSPAPTGNLWKVSYAFVTVLAIWLGLSLYAVLRPKPVQRTKGYNLPLPPGPKPLPILGNILDMPRKNEWETISEWGKQYGEYR